VVILAGGLGAIFPEETTIKPKLLKLDISKPNSELNWPPKINSKEMISLTID
jgi:nucleoside-diphosphate-sugar epimerase